MKRAIAVHRQDFAAVAALVIAAITVVAFVLEHQPSFTFARNYYTVNAQFANGTAVISGQGQAVDVAGVQVGQVGGVHLQDGHAVVVMNLFKKYAPIYRNATVLLRPRTPLKDMYLALDPGTPDAGPVPAGGMLALASTSPTIDVDQILAALDGDTRNYLLLLLAGGAGAFHDGAGTSAAPSPGAVAALRGTFQRFAPLNRDTATLTTLLAMRRQNIGRAIHNLQLVTRSLGGVEGQLASLIRSSNTNFAAISSQDVNLETALSLLPGTLQQTRQTLAKVQGFAAQSGPTLRALLPFANAFGPALSASRPLFADTTPVIRDQLRPFALAVQPLARILRPASADLATATPPLSRAVAVLNALFNTLAYQPRGGLQGYLFWGAWLGHIAAGLANTQDAHGPLLRTLFMSTCEQLIALSGEQIATPSLSALIDLLNPPYKLCGVSTG